MSKNPRPKACVVDMSNFIYKILAKDRTFSAAKLFLGKDILQARQKIFQLLKNEFDTLAVAFSKKNVHLVFEQMKKKKRKYCYQRVKRRSKIIANALQFLYVKKFHRHEWLAMKLLSMVVRLAWRHQR